MFLWWFPTLRSLLYPQNALYKNLNTGYALKNRLISVLLAPGFFSDWYSIVTDGNVWKKKTWIDRIEKYIEGRSSVQIG